nr:choice-of-anchor L domain-containing protein [Salinirubrum litoreum]
MSRVTRNTNRRRFLKGCALGVGLAGLGSATASAQQASLTPDDFLNAIARQDFIDAVQSVSFESDPSLDQYAVLADPAQGFPIDGDDYGVLSSGVAADIFGEATDFSSFGYGTPAEQYPGGGLQAFDVAEVTIEFTVPPGVTGVNFDYRYATEEIPSFVGSEFQDFFTATLAGPDDYEELITVLPDGTDLTVDNVVDYANVPGGSSESPTPPFPDPDDTKFNSVTQLFAAQNAESFADMGLTGETLTLELRLGDGSDSIYDTAAFVDNLTFGAPSGEEPGSEIEVVVPYQVDFVEGPPNQQLGEDDDDFYGRQNRLIQYAHGNKDGVTKRDTYINSLDESVRECVSYDPIQVNGDTARVDFTVADGCELELSLVSYTLPNEEFSFETADEQELAGSTTDTFGPGDWTIQVPLPTETQEVDDAESLAAGPFESI